MTFTMNLPIPTELGPYAKYLKAAQCFESANPELAAMLRDYFCKQCGSLTSPEAQLFINQLKRSFKPIASSLVTLARQKLDATFEQTVESFGEGNINPKTITQFVVLALAYALFDDDEAQNKVTRLKLATIKLKRALKEDAITQEQEQKPTDSDPNELIEKLRQEGIELVKAPSKLNLEQRKMVAHYCDYCFSRILADDKNAAMNNLKKAIGVWTN